MQQQPWSTRSTWSTLATWTTWSEWSDRSAWFPRPEQPDAPLPEHYLRRDELERPEPAPEPAVAEDESSPARRLALIRSLQGAFSALLALAGLVAFAGNGALSAGMTRIHAEHQLAAGDFAGASALLATALQRAPDSTQLLLLKIKADLLAGEANTAFGLIERLGDRAGNGELVAEIDAILARVSAAAAMAREAEAIADLDVARAARLWEEAAELYPESPRVAVSSGLALAAAALERRDLAEHMLVSVELALRHPEQPFVIAQLASAQAARYAETGAPAQRAEAEATLARALELALPFDADRRELDRQAERIRYCLASRRILTQRDYERRFPVARASAPQH